MSLDRTVYIDESFYQWTSLSHKQVNLAYGAVSIPDRALLPAKKRWKAFEKLVHELVIADTGAILPADKEVKFTTLRSLKPESVDKIGQFWKAFYIKHHIRVFGFFSSAEGLSNNSIRNDAYDATPEAFTEIAEKQEELYQNWLSDLLARKEEMKNAKNGDLGVLETVIKNLLSCIFRFHLDLRIRQPFRLVWDQRSGEDDGLRNIINKLVDLVRRDMGLSELELGRFYLGLTMEVSEKQVGIRFADLIAGSYRQLFRSYPELLSDQTKFEIKTAKLNGAMLSPNLPYYRAPMSNDLADQLLSNSRKILFPHFLPSLARDLFSYITKDGEARHCRLSERAYFDLPD